MYDYVVLLINITDKLRTAHSPRTQHATTTKTAYRRYSNTQHEVHDVLCSGVEFGGYLTPRSQQNTTLNTQHTTRDRTRTPTYQN